MTMLWFILALVAAVGAAGYYALVKRYLRDVDILTLGGGVFLCTSAILFTLSFLRGIPDIQPKFYSTLAIAVPLAIASAFFTFKALKNTDLSLAMPMISFTPLFMVVTSFFLLQEFPSTYGLMGIVLIVVGSYVLNTTNGVKILDPFREIIHNKGVMLMLLVALIYSFSANFAKIMTLNSDAFFAPAAELGVAGLFFFLISIKKQRLKNLPLYFLTGFVLSISLVATNSAFLLEIAPYVISIKRTSVLFAVLIGGLLFKEHHLKRRLAGAAVMVVGVLCILLL